MTSLPDADLRSLDQLSAYLQEITEALAASDTEQKVIEIVLTPAVQALGAVAGIVLLVDHTDQQLKIAGSQGYEDVTLTLWQEGPIEDHVLIADILRMKEAMYFEYAGALKEAYPELESRTGVLVAVANATLPMFLDHRPLGVIVLDFKEPHHFTPAERRFLKILSAQCAVALGRAEATGMLEARVEERTQQLEQRTRQLEEERAALAGFARFTEASTHLTDVHTIAQQAGIVLRDLLNVHVAYSELEDDLWKGQVFSEDTPPQVIEAARAGFPTGLPSFARPFVERDVVFVDEWDEEREGAHTTGVYTAAALYPYFRDGKPHGLLTIGSLHASAWTERERSVFRSVGRSLALAFERAEHVRQVESAARAQEVFVAFTEAVGTEMDVISLAQRAVDVLQAHFAEGVGGYYEREGDLWKLRSWTSNLNSQPDVIAALCAGLPSETPFISELLRDRMPVFTESWNAEHEGIKDSEDYGAVAAYPVMVEGDVRGFFTMGFKTVSRWAGRDRASFQSVGRGLDLALERAEQSRRLAAQNAELEARTRALEGFAELSRDFTAHGNPYVLVERAQEVVLSLLPEGFALYHVPEGERWHSKTQVGDMRNPELQAAVDTGLSYTTTANLLKPWTTGQPFYQEQYDRNTDHLGELASEVGATATLPVLVAGEPVGILAVVLFGAHRWSAIDRGVLETTARSLGLALEGARSVAQLAQRTQELERSNAELEQFAYIASHDLQAPIRAVTSFAGVIDKRYGPQLDERGRLYLRQIMESGEHMKRLVDDLLAFSRLNTERRDPLPVDSAGVFDTVRARPHVETQASGASVTRGDLPVVLADAQEFDKLLQNLIANGLKYQREGVSPRIHVSAERDGRMWRFAVSDNGLGIEPQYFERIFVIFQRLHGRETYEGTGIGLAVCKKIVEKHGGRLWLTSTPGEGSTFFFTLPEA